LVCFKGTSMSHIAHQLEVGIFYLQDESQEHQDSNMQYCITTERVVMIRLQCTCHLFTSVIL
jgi:hypothetical protein